MKQAKKNSTPAIRSRRIPILRASVATIIASLAMVYSPRVSAASAQWNVTPTDGNWVTTSGENNWSTGVGTSPGSTSGTTSTDTATFGNSAQTNININSASLNIGSIAFTGGGYTIGSTSGNPLLLTSGGSITDNASSAVPGNTVNAPLVIEGANGSYTVNGATQNSLFVNGAISGGAAGSTVLNVNATGAVTLKGVISNGSATTLGVSTTGSGTVTLLGNNTYTGATTVNGGTLQVGNTISGNLTGTSGVTVTNGGSLITDLFASSTFTPSVSLDSTSSLTVEGGGTTLSGVISGAGSVTTNNNTFPGSGTTILTATDTYTGATTVSVGTLQVGNGSSGNLTATSGVTVNGNLAIDLADGSAFTRNVNLNGTATNLNVIQSGTNTLSGIISGTGAFNGNSLGTTILTGANTYSGVTTINGGTLQIGDGSTAGASIASSGQVQVGSAGTLAVNLADGETFANDVNDGDAVNAIASGTNTFSGVISGSGSFFQTGSGTAILTGANTFTGSLAIFSGTVQIGDGVTAGASVSAATVSVDPSGTLAVNLADGETFTNDVNNVGTVNAIASGTNTFSGTISNSGGFNQNGSGTTILIGANTYTGTTTINAGILQIGDGSTAGASIASSGQVQVGAAGTLAVNLANGETFTNDVNNGGAVNAIASGTNTFSGTISGAGVFNQNGSGTTILTGANTYTGVTTVNAGTLQIGDGSTAGASIASSGQLQVGAAGTLAVNLPNGEIFTNDVNNGGALNALTSGDNYFSGTISGAGAFNQNGSGTTFLTGANTYTGLTTVNAGTLQIGDGSTAGASIASSGQVQVGAAGTLAVNLADGEIFANDVNNGGTLNAIASGTNIFSGTISGAGGFNQNGSGTTVLSGVNSYTGATTVNAGVLQAGSGQAFGIGSAVSITSPGVTLDLNGFSNTIGSLSGIAGSVVDNTSSAPATLTVGNSTSTTFAGILQNSGSSLSLTVQGTGTLILTGASSYTGTTTINSGTLQVGDGSTAAANIASSGQVQVGATGTLAVNLTNGKDFANDVNNGGTVNAIASNLNFFSGTISGAGAFNQNGSGTTILSGVNSYTGPTTVNAGKLQAGSTQAFGIGSAVSITSAGAALDLNGFSNTIGSLSGVAGSVVDNSSSLSPATLTVGNAANTTFAGVIQNTGSSLSLAVQGTGTLILTGANTYTGGTTISAGTLQIGDGATAGASIASSGQVQVAAPGTLAINLTSGSTFANAVDNSGTVNAVASGVNTLSGIISGAGAFNQSGSGTTILTAANTYTGVTTVTAGALVVNGSLASSLTQINTFGILSGNGSVGAVTNNGLVIPGNLSASTLASLASPLNAQIALAAATKSMALTINGNYTQTHGGTLVITYGGSNATQYSALNVNGKATLDGSLRIVQANGAKLSPGAVVPILTATGGVNGKFSSVGGASQLQATLVYEPNSVDLELLAQGSTATTPPAGQEMDLRGNYISELESFPNLSPNLLASAAVLESIAGDPREAALIRRLNNDTPSQLLNDLNRFNPEPLTSTNAVGNSLSNIHIQNLTQRTSALRAGASGFSAMGLKITGSPTDYGAGLAGPVGPADNDSKEVVPPPAAPDNRFGAFIGGAGEWNRVGDTEYARGFDMDSGGITLGCDYKFTENFAAGVFLGYTHTSIDIGDGGGIGVDSGKLGLYSTYFTGGFYLDSAVQGGYDGYNSSRAGIGGIARSSNHGGDLNIIVSPGYDWKIGALTIGLTAGFQYGDQGTNRFTETGSLAPLSVNPTQTTSLTSTIGMKASYDWKLGSSILRPELRLSWQHEYGDTSTDVTSSLASGAGNSFTVTGPVIGRDSMLLGAGFAVVLNSRVSTYVYYDGELFRTNYSSSVVSGGVRITF